ncbi:tetratricopeptide repeat protein [Myxococcota bacterium]|nr:tetratricopeptide repeat protein [Myxococcota bacterium]
MRSRFWQVCVLAILVFGFASCESDEQKLANHMERGDEYFEAEEFPEAIIEYKSALQVDPNFSAAHWALSQTHLKNGQAREGFWELRETVRLDPSNNEARLQFGEISIFAGEPEEGVVQANAVLAEDPESAQATLLLGRAEEALDQPMKAIRTYEKAIELSVDGEDQIRAVALLARLYQIQGRDNKAEKMLRKLTELDPSFMNFVALGSFLNQVRAPDDEIQKVWEQGVEVAQPEELPRAYGTLAGFFFTRDQFEEAKAVLEQGIDEIDDDLQLTYLLARFHNMRGETEAAQVLVEKATVGVEDDTRPFVFLSNYLGNRGDLDGALDAVRKALEIDPEDPAARLRKADLLVDLGFRRQNSSMLDEGRTTVENMLAENEANALALMVLGKIHLASGENDNAVSVLRRAIDLQPELAQAHFLLGSSLALRGERTAARAELAQALELDASLTEARKVLAQVHQALGENEYAVEEARRYLAVDPNDNRVRIILAQSLTNLDRATEALRELEKIDQGKHDAQTNYAMGKLNLSMGLVEQARANFLKALEEMPERTEILESLMALDRAEGRLGESVERVEKALSKNPNSAPLQQLAGTLSALLGRLDDAEARFKKAVELEPDWLPGYERLASLYVQTGRGGQAIEIYEQAASKQPNRPQLKFMLGVLYEQAGKKRSAIERYEGAIRQDPGLAVAKNNLAYLYAEFGDNLDRALDLAQEAKAQLPDNPHAADTLGWVLYKRGLHSTAITYLREAESGIGKEDVNLGLVRHHLALAYEANEETEQALAVVERALSDLDPKGPAQAGQVRSEPAWAADMRAMRERLQSAPEG